MLEPLHKGDHGTKLSTRAAESIQEYISASGLRAGDRIPSERVLAARMMVSRHIVREALKYLETLGIILRKRGGGAFVGSNGMVAAGQLSSYITSLEKSKFVELTEARSVLETGCVKLAMAKSAHKNREELERIFQEYSESMATSCHTVQDVIDIDVRFHQRLVDMAGNPALSRLASVIREYFGNKYVLSLASQWIPMDADEGREMKRIAVERHRELIDAILSGDSILAERVVRQHLMEALPGM